MNVNKGFVAIICVTTLMVIGVACGGGDSTPTTGPTVIAAPIPTPTQTTPSPREISFSEVISMVIGGEIESIEVRGDWLTILTNRGETLASRKEEGSSIADTLAAAGVDPLPGILKVLPPTPPVVKKDAEESVAIHVVGEVTVELALENPMLVARGVDPIPSGFDAVNAAWRKFETPISTVTLELHRDGNIVFVQEIRLDPPETRVRFPVTQGEIDAIPVGLPLGSYDRVIRVTNVDGVTKEVRSDPDSVWLLDPTFSPKAEARLALIAARRMLVDSLEIPYAGPALITFEPVEWRDANLGCTEPERAYAQVITPGFKLVFEYGVQQYEYHTDRDAQGVRLCG